MKNEDIILLNQIAQIIFDKKGFNILALDLRGISSVCDYVMIAEGNVDRHVNAIGQAIVEETNKLGEPPNYIEGIKTGDWVVLDFGFLMVHLFIPKLREKYQLEQLWKEAEIIDVDIDITSKSNVAGDL